MTKINLNAIELAKKLMSFPTITPDEAGSLEFLVDFLKQIGFDVITQQFEDVDISSKPTWNIYAYTRKSAKKNDSVYAIQ